MPQSNICEVFILRVFISVELPRSLPKRVLLIGVHRYPYGLPLKMLASPQSFRRKGVKSCVFNWQVTIRHDIGVQVNVFVNAGPEVRIVRNETICVKDGVRLICFDAAKLRLLLVKVLRSRTNYIRAWHRTLDNDLKEAVFAKVVISQNTVTCVLLSRTQPKFLHARVRFKLGFERCSAWTTNIETMKNKQSFLGPDKTALSSNWR